MARFRPQLAQAQWDRAQRFQALLIPESRLQGPLERLFIVQRLKVMLSDSGLGVSVPTKLRSEGAFAWLIKAFA